ncbi:hypothetical protein ROZALSC1DRAFT_26247, partial [Rozella allomycis CSF55]
SDGLSFLARNIETRYSTNNFIDVEKDIEKKVKTFESQYSYGNDKVAKYFKDNNLNVKNILLLLLRKKRPENIKATIDASIPYFVFDERALNQMYSLSLLAPFFTSQDAVMEEDENSMGEEIDSHTDKYEFTILHYN